MAQTLSMRSLVRQERMRRGWSQDELARRAGLSRAGVSAIEIERLVPSAAAALALAAALERRVEDLFQLRPAAPTQRVWAWPPGRDPARFWTVADEGVERLYPAESTALGMIPHDGVLRGNVRGIGSDPEPLGTATGSAPPTLVLATCDPAVGLLARALAESAGIRLLPLLRSSRAALDLLGRGLVHAAGVHLSRSTELEGHCRVVLAALGSGYSLLRVARWEEGIALAPARKIGSLRAALHANLSWVGREDGSGARQCLDEVLEGRKPMPRRLASDHRGVAEAIRNGWADAGICLRLVSEEAGLPFFPVREESYDLCFPTRLAGDPRLQALTAAVRSTSYRQALGELPGYDSTTTGQVQQIDAEL